MHNCTHTHIYTVGNICSPLFVTLVSDMAEKRAHHKNEEKRKEETETECYRRYRSQLETLGITCQNKEDHLFYPTFREIEAFPESKVFDDEEMKRAKDSLALLKKTDINLISPLVLYAVVRGYWKRKHPIEETAVALRNVSAFRRKRGGFEEDTGVYLPGKGFPDIFSVPMDEKCYRITNYWKFIGESAFGHPVVALRLCESKCDDCLTYFGSPRGLTLGLLTAIQVSEVIRVMKSRNSQKKGHYVQNTIQIYDLAGMGMRHLKLKDGLAEMIQLGQRYYPDMTRRIYLVNTSFLFRTAWSLLKHFVDAETQEKIVVLGSAKEATDVMMKKDGIKLDSLPPWLGGSSSGKDFATLFREIAKTKDQHASAKGLAE